MPQFMIPLVFLLCLFLPHLSSRRNILVANLTLTSLYSITMFLNDLQVGSLIYAVAASGSLSQILLPDTSCKNMSANKMKNLRMIIASLITAIGTIVLYHNIFDLVAIAAFTSARIGEAYGKTVHIRLGYLGSSTLFLAYALLNGNMTVVALQSVLVISSMMALGYIPNLVPHPSRILSPFLKNPA